MIEYIFIIIIIAILLYIYTSKKEHFTQKNKNMYTAVIIEPRDHKALEFVLNNFLTNLSDEWTFIIFHGNKNILYVNDILKKLDTSYRNKITLKNLNVDNLTLPEYNNLLVSKDFYDKIPTEVFLIFQTDSIICSDYKDLINDFIKYDYVGAPWKGGNVGNGGLSLRRKSKMLEIIDKCEYKDEPEDVFFGTSCPDIKRNTPQYEDAKKFSMETIYNDISFGVHKPWIHLKNEDIVNKNNFCKDLSILKKLNNK